MRRILQALSKWAAKPTLDIESCAANAQDIIDALVRDEGIDRDKAERQVAALFRGVAHPM
jgi:hypothetical protein